jgi:Leu/Phe-tRNA-protein transferase
MPWTVCLAELKMTGLIWKKPDGTLSLAAEMEPSLSYALNLDQTFGRVVEKCAPNRKSNWWDAVVEITRWVFPL